MARHLGGPKLYRKLDDIAFRRLLLWLLPISGLAQPAMAEISTLRDCHGRAALLD
jgi:hypothetical protein